jgi:hypothetical protein
MKEQMLIQLGNSIVDLNAIVLADYQSDSKPLLDEIDIFSRIYLSLGTDDRHCFENDEADLLWKLLCDRAMNLTPQNKS